MRGFQSAERAETAPSSLSARTPGEKVVPQRTRASARPNRRHFGRTLRIVAAALIVLVLLGAVGLAADLRARSDESAVINDFQAAQRHLEQGKTLLKQASTDHDPALVDRASSEMRAARASFVAARSVSDLRLASRFTSAPVIGKQLRTVDALSRMGEQVSLAGLDAATVDRAFLASSHSGEEGQGAAKLVNLMVQQEPQLSRMTRELTAANAEAARVDPSALPHSQQPAFAKARASIASGLAGLEEFRRMMPIIQEILGGNGPRTYIVEQVNQTELRAGGGYIGSYTLIKADHGKITVLKSGDTHELPDFGIKRYQRGYIAPPPTFEQAWGGESWSFQDSNFFPSFTENAQSAESFAERDFGTKVDGVIAIDEVAVAGIMGVTGPMTVPGYNIQLNSNNLISETIRLDISYDPIHKKILSALAGPLMERLSTLGAEQWPQLLQAMNTLAGQRHIQTFFNNAPAQAEMQRFGWTGQLQHSPGRDYIYAVESNFGANKGDYFLKRAYTLKLTDVGGQVHHRLQVDLHFDLTQAPHDYTIGYKAYFRLYVPSSATNTHLGNATPDLYPNTNVPDGLKLIDGWNQLNPNRVTRIGDMTLVYDWDTPHSGSDLAIYWQKQPGTIDDHVTIISELPGAKGTASGALTTDLLATLGGKGITIAPASAGAAKLPTLSL